MSQKNDGSGNSRGLVNYTDLESAKNYDQKRFSSGRMKRLDELEKKFARVAYAWAGEQGQDEIGFTGIW